MMNIENALHIDVEEEFNTLMLGNEDVRVQVDELCVFSRKYNVGRQMRTTLYGWVFGIVDDKPDGLLFLRMVEKKDSQTLKGLIQQHVQENNHLHRWLAVLRWSGQDQRVQAQQGESQGVLCGCPGM